MITAANTTVNSSAVSDSRPEFMTEELSLLAGYYMVVICVVGCAENVLILYTFRRHPSLRFISSELVQILCLLDILMALCAFPFILVSCMTNRWVFSDIGCQWYGFCMTAIGIGSMSTLACIAIERFTVINSMKHDRINSTGIRMKKVAIVCSGLGTLAALLPFAGVGCYDHEPVFLSCTPAWWGKRPTDLAFIMIIFSLAFIVPVCFIMFSYIGICVKVASIRIGHRRKRDYIKLTVMSFLMIACFLLSWGPYAVFAVKQALVSDNTLSAMENVIPVMMAKSCILWNPILYLGGNVHFREVMKNDLKEMLTLALSKVGKKVNSETTENNELGFVGRKTENSAESCQSNKASDTAPEREVLIKQDLNNGGVRLKGVDDAMLLSKTEL